MTKPRKTKSKEAGAESARRGSYRIFFGRDTTQWSLGDPGHPLVSRAQHRIRGKPLGSIDGDALVVASIASDMNYLVHGCPSTKLACEKLAALRAAVRKLGPVDEESAQP